MDKRKIKGFKINDEILAELDLGKASKVISRNGTEFTVAVTNGGVLYVYSGDTDIRQEESIPNEMEAPSNTETTTSLASLETYKLYINSLYCGGLNADEHTMNFCSHNFVELANCSGKDLNLKGLSLQYAISDTDWKVLPLSGVIKNGSTFLIRGARCGIMDMAKINVDSYDMEWKIDATGNYTPTGTPISFSTECAKFYLCHTTEKCTVKNPYYVDGGSTATAYKTYIDLIGINGASNTDGFETTAYPGLSSERLFKKYYALDPVKQATKDLSARKNSTLWNYVDLTKQDGEIVPEISAFTPKASFEKKDIFNDKTSTKSNKPLMLTCSFGIEATDNGSGATRCFNWLSYGIKDEFLFYKKQGTSEWIKVESFKNETGVRRFYNRLSREVSNGTVVTAHKVIISGLTSGTYEYMAGTSGNTTSIRKFTVKAKADVANEIKFVQTTDQQGFTWDEYQVWAAASNTIMNIDNDSDGVQFMINTGDIAQNGNRMNEWLDYFDAKCPEMNDLEEMCAVGNNDLSPKKLFKLGDGEDACKVSMENYQLFFAGEIDENNPPVFEINGTEYFIPSLYSFNYGNVHFMCVNTEIKRTAESNPSATKEIYESIYDFSNFGNFYPLIKQWCENDFTINDYQNKRWNIVYCHEMPFTLLTTGVTLSTKADTFYKPRTFDGGCHASDNMPGLAAQDTNNGTLQNTSHYWFSEFCQTHNVRLVLGGHKHTQATTWPIIENVKYADNGNTRYVDSWHPIIVLPNSQISEALKDFKLPGSEVNPTSLVEITDGGVTRKYPNTWVSNGQVVPEATGLTRLCEFKTDNEIGNSNAVVYAMSQATGYKHTSNKELPAPNIPWLRYYYPTSTTKPDGKQKFPFYTIWKITPNNIIGKVKKVKGILNSGGTFDINNDGVWAKQGLSTLDETHTTPLTPVNGLSADIAENSDKTIEVIY